MEKISNTDSKKRLAWYFDWQRWPLVPDTQAEIHYEPRQPLPPTPDLPEHECEEIILLADTVDIGFFADLLYPPAPVRQNETAPNFSLPTPWLKNGAVILPGTSSHLSLEVRS